MSAWKHGYWETRQMAKHPKKWKSTKQSLAGKDPSVWAQDLLTLVASKKDSSQQKFDDLNATIWSLKKDTRAMHNRVENDKHCRPLGKLYAAQWHSA